MLKRLFALDKKNRVFQMKKGKYSKTTIQQWQTGSKSFHWRLFIVLELRIFSQKLNNGIAGKFRWELYFNVRRYFVLKLAKKLAKAFLAIPSLKIRGSGCGAVAVWPKKSPNVCKSCPKMISLEKWMILTALQKLPMNAEDLGKLMFAKGFKKWSKVQ